MDPYLEGHLWTSVHLHLASEVARQLTPRLQPRYMALPQQRFILDAPEDIAITAGDIYPDIGVVREGPPVEGSAATVAEAPLQLITVMPSPVPHSWVEIRDVAQRQLVTVIEFLSPTNKRGEGRREYLEKRKKILLSTAHLLEIDLLRKGQRVPMVDPLPAAAYFVVLSRAGDRPKTQVWPIALDQPLPCVPVPLLSPDPDVALDLQAAVTTVYDTCGYALAAQYQKPPDVPLPSDAGAWAEQRLRQAGLRP
jgi:hypothetical protein